MFRRILLPCLALALVVSAADKPNFTGNWHLHEGKSDVTHSHLTKKVTQTETQITVNNTTLQLDGKPNGQGVSAKLEAGGLVIRTKHEKMSMEERWTLSADGKSITIATKASGGPGGSMTMSQQYSKE